MLMSYFHILYLLFPFPLAAAIQTQCLRNTIFPSSQLIGNCTRPLDDDTPAHLFSRRDVPWTQPPYCIIPHPTGSPEKFCVYSSSTYNNGRGISVVVRPETAASVGEAIQDPLPAWNSHRHLTAQGRLQTEIHDLPYAVVSMPGKGQGIIATRYIKQFDTIMTSFPAMVADNIFLLRKNEERPAKSQHLLRKALQQLTDKERFLGLARSKGEDVDVVEDLIQTNSFGITVDDRDMKAVYPEIARLNHGCDPNKFTKKDLAMSAVATRDIEPGEEITISYISLGMPTAQRAKHLRNWGFNCTCNLCAAPSTAREASDKRREQLMEVYYAMQDESTSYNRLVELTAEFNKLAKAERLLAKIGEYYQVFMRIYYNVGDLEAARKYGEASLRLAEIFTDPEGSFCSGLRRDLKIIERELREKVE